MSEAPHVPVLINEVVEALEPGPGKTVVDGTFGAGGYSRAFLDRGARVIAFDRDPSARRFAPSPESADQFRLVGDRFSAMAEELGEGAADGVALDLGVSSMQLDEPERGFSFMRDGPLDMRMGKEGPSASDIVNELSAGELAEIIGKLGEEGRSRAIAKAIVARRAEAPIETTKELSDVVARVLGR